jgi:hypothetical protein
MNLFTDHLDPCHWNIQLVSYLIPRQLATVQLFHHG